MTDDEKERFLNLLKTVEKVSPDAAVGIDIGGGSDHYFSAQELKDVLMTVLLETPALREALTIWQEPVPGETLSFKPSPWEYDYIPFNPLMNYINAFNKKGADCWELVHCDFEKGIAIFKRPK